MIPLPLHTKSLKPSSLNSIFSSLSTLSIDALPGPIPALVPDLDDLRKDLAIRRGHDPNSSNQDPDQAQDRNDNDNDKVEGSNPDTAPAGTRTGTEDSTAGTETETIYMGIATTDSTVVYYKLTKGIKKPADIPDE